jgi:limonene-1,2-epoxide hydrolase
VACRCFRASPNPGGRATHAVERRPIIFTDGARGVHEGVKAVRSVVSDLQGRGVRVHRDVKTIVGDEATVVMERVDSFELARSVIQYGIAVALEIDAAGQISRSHEYCEINAIGAQITASLGGSPLHE